MTSAVALLRGLGLFERIGSDVPKLDDSALADFEHRRRAFDWIHLGTTELPLGQLFDALESAAWLSPVRSGHIGNWSDIAAGRAGTLDYNLVLCRQLGLAQPLVYDLNQTEDRDLASGDWIYLPGSIVDQGERRPLQLHSWNGERFVPRDRDRPLLTPFVLADLEGELVPLSRVHRERMRTLDGWRFRFEADVLLASEERVRSLLVQLVGGTRQDPRPDRALEDLFDRSVATNGTVERRTVRHSGDGFVVAEERFGSAEELVDAAMVPLRAAARPEVVLGSLRELPGKMPLLSAVCVNVLYGILGTHLSQGGEATKAPCNPHVHWGAIGMAGYPPRRHGYFREKTRVARRLCEVAVAGFDDVDPLFYVLIPVAPLILWPSDAYPEDAPLVENLIAMVHRKTDSMRHQPHAMEPAVRAAVEDWRREVGGSLSPYYAARFERRRSVWAAGEVPEQSLGVEPAGFRDLTFRQASMLVGELMEPDAKR